MRTYAFRHLLTVRGPYRDDGARDPPRPSIAGAAHHRSPSIAQQAD